MTMLAAALTALAYGVLLVGLLRACRARQAALVGAWRWALLAVVTVIGVLAAAQPLLCALGDSAADAWCGALAGGAQLAGALLLFPVLRRLERRIAVITGRRIRRRAARANAEVDAAYSLLAIAEHRLAFGHWRLAADGALTWSDQLCDILGWPAETAPSAARALALCQPEERALVRNHLRACQQDGAAFSLSLLICRPDGERRHVILHGAGAGPGAVAGVLIDVTDQRAAAAHLREAQDAAQRARDQLRANTTIDRLTGLPNRRSFEASLATEVKRALRANLPLALILLDVDRLSHFNRAYTQAAGDACLRHVAGAMSALPRRAGDVLAHHGGGSFAMLLPLVDMRGALVVAEGLRAAVQSLAIAHAGTETGLVTLSLGISSMNGAQDPHAAAALHSRAQGALFVAKRQGGDRICTHEAPFSSDHRIVILQEVRDRTPA